MNMEFIIYYLFQLKLLKSYSSVLTDSDFILEIELKEPKLLRKDSVDLFFSGITTDNTRTNANTINAINCLHFHLFVVSYNLGISGKLRLNIPKNYISN
jgi:hypothetical protein